ncbi:hypothetical protein BJY04DRAFT_41126 [Aspergillus karnatakaensis]|uniref:DNA damage response protein RcaA n=1 Tax=Aspergillus karnatakaensis TaxID=1810916 RepID=UPI003CCCAD3B
MWILDSEGGFLEGKRVWLRPGKKYLFGRVKEAGYRGAIPSKSISRKHLVIEVSAVNPGDGSKTRSRSVVTVSDEGSKYGTVVNGEQIRGKSKELAGDAHTLFVGKYSSALRIKWQPTVLSFSFSSKEISKNALARYRSQLEGLDIKTIDDYIVNVTTHVVQTKRNTAKGLLALVNGNHIVDYSFIDALDYAATPSDLENLESLSPLEADFDGAWPNEKAHLPPSGKEVVNYSDEAFASNPDRVNVFEGYTFVFLDKGQKNLLEEPITNGHGKALHFEAKEGVTTAEEVVQFMRNAAGQKDFGSARDGPGGVGLVRFRNKTRNEKWFIELDNEVALMIDQRVTEQNEFLNAILGNDASILCRPLPQELRIEPTPEFTPAPPSSEDVQVVADSQPSEDVSQPSNNAKRGRVRKYVSKMKTFDDGFDINSIPVYAPDVEEAMDDLPPLSMEAPTESHTQQADSLQKEEDVVSSLLPGATAMKRLRAETSQRSMDDSSSRPKEEEPRPKRQKLDVLEAARQHREAEEDAARQRRQQDEELLQSSLKDIDVEKLKGLAIVEEMEIPAKKADDKNRWDERWNGRKNFKKFRRKGDPSQPRRRIQAVIVPLEEVARKDFGIGDHYWVSTHRSTDQRAQESHEDRGISQVDSEPPERRPVVRSESEKTTTQRSQKRVRDERDSDSDDELRFRFRRKR